jgi:hypothetical protein
MLREGPLGEVLWAVEAPGYLVRVLESPELAARTIQSLAGVGDIEIDAETGEVRFRCEGGAEAAAGVVAAVVGEGLHLARFGETEGSLEAAFVRMAREESAAQT